MTIEDKDIQQAAGRAADKALRIVNDRQAERKLRRQMRRERRRKIWRRIGLGLLDVLSLFLLRKLRK
jgi:hypothetical protein